MASIFSAVNYGFNTYIIKVIADVELYVAVIVSVICNLLGVYLGMLITDKMRKEQLWKITVTVPTDKMNEFKKKEIDNDYKKIG